MFNGAITALITPFRDGKFDETAYINLINWQIEQGISGLVPCGTTGESPTLSHEEHSRVVEVCVKAVKGRVPVIAGAGSNSTDEAIELAKHAKHVGADAILVATPYYNKPNQEGMYQHFKAINDAVAIPLVLYNIPGRSVVDLTDVTIAKLAQLKNIVGIKDATGNLARVSSLRIELKQNNVSDFCQLSGEDGTAVAFNAQGGVGVISVTANVAPKLVADVQKLTLAGAYKEALQLHDQLMPLHIAMFLEPSPGPVKYAASKLGLCSDAVRLPLTKPSEGAKQKIDAALANIAK